MLTPIQRADGYSYKRFPAGPTFDRPFQADEGRISIKPSSNMYLIHVPHLLLADLAATCSSPLFGEANIRGKGEKHCL